MSNTFFASVRRNQKQWMVAVTVLSMVSFLFLDYFGGRKGPMNPLGGGLLVGCVVAAGMTIVGYPRGLTAEFGTGGFIIGFLAGYLGFGSIGAAKPIVQTSSGQYSVQDLRSLANRRGRANQFIGAVSRKLNAPVGFNFGNIDEMSVLQEEMLLADAKKMGIQISDERVNELLRQITQGNLTRQQFKECLREAQTSEGELFDQIKARLATQLVIGLTEPPTFAPPVPPEFARMFQSRNLNPMAYAYMQQTPQQLWDEFQKLTLKQSLQAAAVPVRDFVAKIPEPSETEVGAFYARYLNQRWIDESRPGFTKLPSVKLAYLTADFEKFEKGADPTEADISDYYTLHKHEYRITPSKPPESEPKKEEAKPADDAKPKDEAAPAGQENKPATEESKGADSAKPEAEQKKDDSKSQCGDEPAAEKKDDAAKKDEPAAATADKPAEPAKEPEAKTADKIEMPAPALSESPESLPAPKFRELDDELKLEIRDAIIRERAFDKIVAELDLAYEFMVGLGLEYDATSESGRAEKAKGLTDQVKEYAKVHNLEYVETEELTYDELYENALGTAVPVKGGGTVTDDVFAQLESGEPRTPLFLPHRANSRPPKDAYCYWKTAQIPMQPYSLKDEAVRARVVAAWKFDQARPVAEKRAQELVAKIKAASNDLPAALAGESVTGDKDAPAIAVIPTDEFTWLRTSSQGMDQTPTISMIPLIEDIGESFMKTVFEELNDGDVGLAPDESRSVFYVVKVMNRQTGKNDDGGIAKYERQQQFMKEEFGSLIFPIRRSPYQVLASYPQRQILQNWNQNFEQEHSVEWREGAQPARNTRVPQRRR